MDGAMDDTPIDLGAIDGVMDDANKGHRRSDG